ncbi:MMPL family transporter [Anaerocolumna sp. AGMB13025]|uniref:MMPL family transporter n=1 Tax=Anaerocolumna sp. AGMB13025 TaxID=3039116 RepID=UPI00241D2857|nr:MMPL family transporter [Anaerocolumna sp. AGMB13025]WFR59652.1 MMPL family transporter [Anaerocolumna sp. AGMB13025]
MRKIIQFRFILLAAWIAVTLLFAFNQPDIRHILSDKGEATINEDAPSKTASKMLEKMSTSKGDNLILMFYKEDKISERDMDTIEKGITHLKDQEKELGITGILDPFGTPEAKEQLISGDKTTMLVQITYEKGKRDRNEVMDDFETAVKDIPVTHYLTGETAINNDYLKTVSSGVDKSAAITVIFILAVLIILFRSVVTPLVSLFAVGISYICSMGIIGIFINVFNFPITSFTQMFVILVLFGIGTDYHILLLNRFKEELSHGLSVDEAIATSLRTAGKTIIFSGLTVFIGFLSLSFVQFPIYRSANAVAIGIAVLLIEILTLTPVFMKLLAGKLFWPSKSSSGHKESKFWARMTSASVKHPIISLLITALIIVPIILFNTTKLSFDSMSDMDPDIPSVKAFNIISDKFGEGKAMPVTLVINNNESMDTNEALAVIDNLTETLKTVNGVATVSGPTQPKGEIIDDLYTNNQIQKVADGLSDADDGIEKVTDGLNKIEDNLTAPDFSKVKELSKGSGDLSKGMTAVTDGLKAVDQGINQGADGADSLAEGIQGLKTGVSSLNSGIKELSANFTTIKNGYTTLGESYKTIYNSIASLKQLETAMEGSVGKIDGKLPNDPDVAALKAMLAKLSTSLDGLTQGMNLANTNYDALTKGLNQIDTALITLIKSTDSDSDLVTGINKLEAGATALSTGLKEGSAGQQKIITSMAQLSAGADSVHTGVDTLSEGLDTLSNGITYLKDGIGASKDGLGTISEGIDQGTDFLTELTATKSFYIPEDGFNNAEITKMLDTYMSKDRKYAKLTINLDSEPYADSSIKLIDKLNTVVENQLEGTVLSNAAFGISGATATSKDMSDMAVHDITFTQCIVLAAIFILLILVIRSFWIPVYIVGALLTAYYTALSATAFLSGLLFNNPNGMAWNVPFFSFVMIAALGVDYSIFLMERFKEYSELSAKEAIIMAAKNIGGVVMSAAIILSGTFATLYPSNLVVLMELAICVIIGLLLLSMILLPVVIPALITLQEKITLKTERN